MNNAVSTSIRRIKLLIPNDILEIALKEHSLFGIEHAIQDVIIAGTVVPDCNLSGGNTIQIPLLAEYAEHLNDESYSVYRIPPSARSNRNIVEVCRVQHDPVDRPAGFAYLGAAQTQSAHSYSPYMHAPAMGRAMESMVSSKSGMSRTPRVPIAKKLQGDLIQLLPSPEAFIPWLITCRVEYDNAMTNLTSEAVDRFAELALVAAKTYCYTTLILKIDQGYKEFGADIPAIRDIISKWDDLEELYREKLLSFNSAEATDIERAAPIIRMCI